jgi:aminoglycoside phosphotransferase (APT) family kinase protein
VPQWQPEIVVDEGLAGLLVAEQFPQFRGAPVNLLGRGWDYTAHRVAGDWVFRFPRREIVLPGMANEIAVVPRLARALPVQVPAAEQAGVPSGEFPWPFFGARFIYGREAADSALDDDARGTLARPLARTLRVLHSRDVLESVGSELPDDPIGRGDMAKRVPAARDRLAELGWKTTAEIEGVLADAESLPRPDPTAVCHGDLHVRQFLIGDDDALAGIIDWVDVCRGDPGIDLSLVWSFLPPPARDDFLGEYGAVSGESLLRARVLALFLNATLALYARAEKLPALERECVEGLRRTASP